MDKDIKNVLENILNKLEFLEQAQKSIIAKQDEIFYVVKAIEHTNELHKAEIV